MLCFQHARPLYCALRPAKTLLSSVRQSKNPINQLPRNSPPKHNKRRNELCEVVRVLRSGIRDGYRLCVPDRDIRRSHGRHNRFFPHYDYSRSVHLLEDTTQPLQTRFDSAFACIIGMFCTNILFMPTWKLFPPYFPKKWSNGMVVFVMTILSLLVWFVSAIALALLQQWMASLGVSMFAFCFCLLLLSVVCGAALCWHLPPAPAGKNKVKWYVHFLRGFVASLAILASGILSQTGSGVAAGAVSTFPAMFITTMVSVSLSQGADVSTGAIGPLLLGGDT